MAMGEEDHGAAERADGGLSLHATLHGIISRFDIRQHQHPARPLTLNKGLRLIHPCKHFLIGLHRLA